MREQDWETLLWSLKRRHCILFLGPEIRSADGGPSPARLQQELARSLLAELGETAVTDDSITSAVRRYRARNTPGELRRHVEAFYSNREALKSPVIEELAKLPFYFVLTSCHDSLLSGAFKSAGKDPRVAYYDYKGEQPPNLDMGSPERPLVYHLYGIPGFGESLVISEQDLLDFLVAVVKKDPQLPEGIRGELRKSGKSLLFLGFGIKHWHFRVVLHVLRATQAENRSFALEAFDNVSAREDAVYFYNSYQIEVLDTAIPDFVSELRKRYEQSGGASPTGAVPVSPTAPVLDLKPPRVFLCHADEDTPLAQQVSVRLRAAGCQTWLDKDAESEHSGLRGGDVWDRRIRESLETSDYCLVFLTKALARKKVSYVNREIALALERQSYFRQGNRFIIPVQIEECEIPDEISRFQAERLPDPNVTDGLARLILRDYQLRARQ